MIADSAGRAVAFSLAPGQAHELPHAVPLLATLPGVPLWVVGDRGYSSHAQQFLSAHGMIYGHFRPRRHLMTAGEYRRARTKAFRIWQQETCVQTAS